METERGLGRDIRREGSVGTWEEGVGLGMVSFEFCEM